MVKISVHHCRYFSVMWNLQPPRLSSLLLAFVSFLLSDNEWFSSSLVMRGDSWHTTCIITLVKFTSNLSQVYDKGASALQGFAELHVIQAVKRLRKLKKKKKSCYSIIYIHFSMNLMWKTDHRSLPQNIPAARQKKYTHLWENLSEMERCFNSTFFFFLLSFCIVLRNCYFKTYYIFRLMYQDVLAWK